MPTVRPAGTVPPVVSAMSMGVVADVWMAFTIASRNGPPPPPMSNTSGVPVPSTAPVRRPSADRKTDGSGDGPVLVVGAPPGAMPSTRTPAAFSAATPAGTGPVPEGATAFGTVFAASDLASLTKPKRESPGESAQAKRLEGSLPPVPVMVAGTAGAVNGATGQVSVARITSRREAGRNPAPPMLPECGTPATSVENAGTSPLVSGEVWVAMFPAGCAPLIPVVPPLPSPSNPLPVATWWSPSSADSGVSPPNPGAVRHDGRHAGRVPARHPHAPVRLGVADARLPRRLGLLEEPLAVIAA